MANSHRRINTTPPITLHRVERSNWAKPVEERPGVQVGVERGGDVGRQVLLLRARRRDHHVDVLVTQRRRRACHAPDAIPGAATSASTARALASPGRRHRPRRSGAAVRRSPSLFGATRTTERLWRSRSRRSECRAQFGGYRHHDHSVTIHRDRDAARRDHRRLRAGLGVLSRCARATRDRAFPSPGGRVTLLDAGRATLELTDEINAQFVDEVEVGRRVAGHIRVAFEVPDAEIMTPRVAAAGAAVVAGPTPTPWGSLNARLEAPAGLQLSLFSSLES
jgi:lactoylglutathione lyase